MAKSKYTRIAVSSYYAIPYVATSLFALKVSESAHQQSRTVAHAERSRGELRHLLCKKQSLSELTFPGVRPEPVLANLDKRSSGVKKVSKATVYLNL